VKRVVLLAAIGLVGCAGRGADPAGPVAHPMPTPPDWTRDAASSRGRVVGVGVEGAAFEAPSRIQRDLADAGACDSARRALRARAEALPAGSVPGTSRELGAALGRASFPGCRIDLRECRQGPGDRRWCWSRAVLDSSDLLPVLARHCGTVSEAARDSLARAILGVR